MNKAISVSLAKIDYDFGKPHIKILADNPSGYVFNKFLITVQMLNESGQWVSKYFDATSLISGYNDIALDLPVHALEGVYGPSIYFITLESENSAEEELSTELVLSDVHDVYRTLLSSLVNTSTCDPLDDNLIKKYLLLYGHQQALQDDLDVAKEYFKLLHNGFSKCSTQSCRASAAQLDCNKCGCS